jgi:hypothetical protein
MNNMAKLPFELSLQISRARLSRAEGRCCGVLTGLAGHHGRWVAPMDLYPIGLF